MNARKTLPKAIVIILSAPLGLACAQGPGPAPTYPVVDTGQDVCFDDAAQISCAQSLDAWFGQDAQYLGRQPAYLLAADGLSVDDQITGLTWQRSPDIDGDGDIDADDKLTWTELQAHVDLVNAQVYGGYRDWRLPSIKELYSLIDFRGTDPSPEETETTGLVPFIDTGFFDFAYGDTAAGERAIDSQWATGTLYVADQNMMFGVNFADGRIKGYGLSSPDPWRGEKTFYVRLVRGGSGYGTNAFTDNGDDTITDNATGLTWMRYDSMQGMPWQEALAWCSDAIVGGYDDWRLPNAKALQSIVDYGMSPDTTATAAIDARFDSTPIVNEADVYDFPYYWTSTTHIRGNGSGESAVYLSFGRALGEMSGLILDVHGAGSQRSDPKSGSEDQYPVSGIGPQGDVQRVYNHVRCVRGGVDDGIFTGDGGSGGDPGLPEDGCVGLSAGDTCTASDGESGVCRTGPQGLRCAPRAGSMAFRPPLRRRLGG